MFGLIVGGWTSACLRCNHFEKLSGKLKDKCSIRVNNQWRIIFIWDDERGEADGIYLYNHTYK
ncbi:MAG: type II toxin-antitoxin system RelE/ParE family toxin [Proteobacteria bacterium]|nr:type II toxin-antitoxin system RelE/ParE family toxin [Pseudomonadota bacterium]